MTGARGELTGFVIRRPARRVFIPGFGKGARDADSQAVPGRARRGGAGSRPASDGGSEAVVISQVHGNWGRVLAVRGLPARRGWKNAGSVSAVSCTSAGSCVAVGSYAGFWPDAEAEVQEYLDALAPATMRRIDIGLRAALGITT